MAGPAQASTLVARGGANRAAATGSAPPPSTGVRRRAGAGSSRGGGKLSQNVMNFYTDDSPGLKISPVVVISMSIGFILFVTCLHIMGKIRGQ